MSVGLTPDQLDDFVELTLKNFKRNKWTDISLPYQKYVASRFMRKNKVEERGGEQISWRVQVKNSGLARNTGMFATDVTGVEDVMVSAQTPWAMQTVNYSYDIDEPEFQSDRETIIRILKVREHDALNSMAELNEENLWSAPTSGSDKRPMGIPFWLQKDATTNVDGGFEGGNPAGFAGGAGGIDSDEYARWRNYTFGYTNITTDDLVKKVKKALTFCHFAPPVQYASLQNGSEPDYEILTTYRVQEPLERLAETRNDQLGSDVARFMNQVTIGGVPLSWVPYLENNDLDDPLYGINWKTFRPFCKRGCQMRRSAPKTSPSQHTVRTVHIDNWMNYMCIDRRGNFVGSLQ
jgi:hypothetical protein